MTSAIVIESNSWGQAALTASLTVFGLVVTQSIVIGLFRRSERKRLDPFVVQCCAEYGSAVGRMKMQLHDKALLTSFSDYETSYERLALIAPDEIQLVMESIQSNILLTIRSQVDGDSESFQRYLMGLFRDQMKFTQVARKCLEQKEKVHRATPMIEAEDLEQYAESLPKD